MKIVLIRTLAGATFATMLTCLTGCGSADRSASDSKGATISVVASTDVWGDVVKQIAGDLAGHTVEVTSIITDPDADPHSYEANTQNQLALSKADVVVENGGGYDDFIDTMMKSAHNDGATVLDAVTISGKKAPEGGELNEHVWYDLPTVQKVAAQISAALQSADPDAAATFARNAATFDQSLQAMEKTEAAIKAAHDGEGAAITEPVPLYLLEACGLVNKTPPEFSEAIEEGTDVPPRLLQQTEEVFDDKQVKLLAYNEQTSGPESEAVLKAARANHVGVVPVTETLPAGKDYVSWMQSNLAAVQAALQ